MYQIHCSFGIKSKVMHILLMASCYGSAKKTPSSFSVVVFSYQKTVMQCVVDVMSFGTKLIQSNSHKLWRIISTHFFDFKTSVQKNRDSEQRVRQEMGDLYALDFDGVICDSCGESSLSAVKAAKVRWPTLFNGVDLNLENWVVDQMHIVRPVVETGYENLLLVRLLLEMRVPSIRKSSVAEGLTVEGILDKWSQLKPVIMEEWGEDKDALIHLFGKVRDEWMDQDLTTWIGANRLYPGVSDALKFASSTIYIVTTKQSRFADTLLRELAGVTIPPERMFGLGSGPKVEVLKLLQKKPEHQGLKLHFVEDRLATLKNVIKEPELDGWSLYLGDWGYNTEKERDEATRISRIQILQLSDFSMKLK